MKIFWIALVLICSSITAQEKVRVMISNSEAWEAGGGFKPVGGSSGGSRPQSVELMKTFAGKCKQIQITSNPERADYVVLFDRQGGKSKLSKDSKIAVFEKGGDMVVAKSVRTVGGAVEDACEAILKHEKSQIQR